MVTPAGLEPAANGLEVRRSVQLSYGAGTTAGQTHPEHGSRIVQTVLQTVSSFCKNLTRKTLINLSVLHLTHSLEVLCSHCNFT